jgi:hypothetical protein
MNMLGAIDLTSFDAAIADVETALPLIGAAMVGVTVVSLGINLVISWVRRIRSAV